MVEEYRRRGVGRALLGELIEHARGEGIERLSLSVERDNQARRLYEGFGFRGVAATEGGSLTMVLDLGGRGGGAPPAAVLTAALVLGVVFAQYGLRWGAAAPCLYTYPVVRSCPHDPAAFTQGVVFDGGTLYEGTGIRWQSSLREAELEMGMVIGWIDLAGLLNREERPGSGGVLNGIAHDGESGRLFVTGKLWPRLFEIEVVAAEE